MSYLIIIFPLVVGALFLITPKRKSIRVLLSFIKVLAVLLLVVFLLRLYWFDIDKIPSESMARTLMVGDKIIIRKNTLPQNNDIVVFKKRMKKEITFVKRCIGIPGDTLSIVRNNVYCNSKAMDEQATLQWVYQVDTINLDKAIGIIKREPTCFNDRLLLTKNEAQAIMRNTENTNMRRVCIPSNVNGKIYPNAKGLVNNRDNISPFIVPEKGIKIALDEYNTMWYRRLIRSENPNITSDEKDNLYLNNQKIDFYTFKKNYYYMMGDNRHRSCDSRSYGFIPQDKIIGRVVLIIPKLRK